MDRSAARCAFHAESCRGIGGTLPVGILPLLRDPLDIHLLNLRPPVLDLPLMPISLSLLFAEARRRDRGGD